MAEKGQAWKRRWRERREREHFLESHERDVARMHIEELVDALSESLEEIEQLGAAYSVLRKEHDPPYLTYIPWSRPKALRVLQALRLEKVWNGEKYVLRLTDASFQDQSPTKERP